MKYAIYLSLVAVLGISACGGETASNQGTSPPPSAQTHVERRVSQETDIYAELKGIGLLTPSQSIEAPDIALKDLEARSISLYSLRGKVVFLNFWGTWCGYCREEMPSIQRMYNTLKNREFEVLAVSVNDTPEAVKSFVSQNNYTFPVVLDLEYKATQLYGIRGFPTTYIIDKKGNLVGKLVGSRSWDTPEVITVFNKLINYEP
jgi:peroxiredoxin